MKKEFTRNYWLAKHYDTIIVNGVKKWIFPESEKKLFDVLHEAQGSIGHGGKDQISYH